MISVGYGKVKQSTLINFSVLVFYPELLGCLSEIVNERILNLDKFIYFDQHCKEAKREKLRDLLTVSLHN